MSNTFPVRLGDKVETCEGPGVVTDRDTAYGAALVRLDAGTVVDTSHGQWLPVAHMLVVGFDPDAVVWFCQRQVRAADVPGNGR